MPRIDPLQLLKCLGVLLTPEGGIRTQDEVQRLANLMTKYSKKLVSKCVYILILKNSEAELLDQFMTAGGWFLIHTWLSDGIIGKNWALVNELLELLLLCPVDVVRLKSNNIPKLVKALSKDESLPGIKQLACELVDSWLRLVKVDTRAKSSMPPGTASAPTDEGVEQEQVAEAKEEVAIDSVNNVEGVEQVVTEEVHVVSEETAVVETVVESTTVTSPTREDTAKPSSGISPKQFYNSSNNAIKTDSEEAPVNFIEVKSEDKAPVVETSETISITGDAEKKEKKEKSKHEKHKHSKSSSSKSHHHSKEKNKDKDRSKSKDKDREKTKDNASSSKDRDKIKDKHRANGLVKSSSSHKDKNVDKEKTSKLLSPSIAKLGKIPKKPSDDKDKKEKKKSTISIEVRKNDGEPRPKTVKVFNSKMRSTGLEEVPLKPPPRITKKSAGHTPTTVPHKRSSSPPKEVLLSPPEKKPRISLDSVNEPEKPGGIKLIPPKPKPMFLQESDMFMDALTAATKKDVKKRKRRPSVSKDGSTTSATSTTTTVTTTSSPPTSPTLTSTTGKVITADGSAITLKGITAPKFYKDTLEEPEEEKTGPATPEAVGEVEEMVETTVTVKKTVCNQENIVKEVDGLRGVLVHHRRRTIKKSVKWKSDSELESIQYFELDETERVNVTKTFMDMKQMEHVNERQALLLSRKLTTEDLMDEKTTWRALIPIDLPPPLAEPGKKSTEKEVQHARERSVLQALYFPWNAVPDSPGEPDPESHQHMDPVIIPLEDVAGSADSINDYQNTPWPEPKGSPPPANQQMQMPVPQIFQNLQTQFNPNMNQAGYPGMQPHPFGPPNANFMPPNMMGAAAGGGGGEWRPQISEHPPMGGPMGGDGPMGGHHPPPNIGGPPGNFPPPQGFHPPNQNFNFHHPRGGRGGFRGRGGGGPWFRPHWRGGGGGGGGGGGHHWSNNRGVCKQFQMKGFCNKRDNCPYAHPNQGPNSYNN